MNGFLEILRRALAISLVLLMPPTLAAYLGEQGIPGFTWSLPQIGWPWILWVGAAMGVAGAIAWSILAHDRNNETFHAWADLLVRHSLALIFFTYGLSKLFRLQFYEPYYYWQETPAGDLNGFAVTWFFFGSSYAYSVFVGMGEILSAALLLARRTRTAGALLLVVVASNILAVNIAYDIGVAWFAGMMLAGAFYVLMDDVPRLLHVLAGDGPTPARREPIRTGGIRTVSAVTGMIAVLIPVIDKVRDVPRGAPVVTALTGAWARVDGGGTPVRGGNGAGASPMELRSPGWDRITFEKNFGGQQVHVRMGGAFVAGRFRADTVARTLRITLQNAVRGETWFAGRYEITADTLAVLRGTVGEDSIAIRLVRVRSP